MNVARIRGVAAFSRGALLGVLLALATPVVFPVAALAQSADEEAALILYESGRDRFKAGDLEGSVKDLEKAYSLAPNQFVRYYLALALSGLGRCEDAIPHLQALYGFLKGDQETARREAVAACDLKSAESLSRSGDCPAVNRLLSGLPSTLPPAMAERRSALTGACELLEAEKGAVAGRCGQVLADLEGLDSETLTPDNSRRRASLLARCRREILGFEPQTAAQKAAAVLVQEGLSLQAQGRETDAATRYEKALRLFDDPTIRLKAARARVVSGACAEGLAHAEAARKGGLPGLDVEMADLKAWCDTFAVPVDAPLSSGDRKALQARYRAALQAGDAGLPDLVDSLTVYDQPRVRLFAGRRLAGKGEWDAASRVLEGAVGRLPPDREKEVAELLALARFAARDGNTNPDKAAVFATWSKGRALLDAGRDSEAVGVLRPIEKNPLVARDLAEIAGRRGDCAEARERIRQAAAGVKLGDEWVKGLLDRCTQVAEKMRKDRAHQAAEAAAAERAGKAKGRRIASYVLWATGAVAAGVGGYFAWSYTDARSDVIAKMRAYDRVVKDPLKAAGARSAVKSAQDKARLQIYLGAGMGVASAALIAGGVVTWLQAKAIEGPPAVTVSPILWPAGSAGLALQGGF